VAVSVALTVGAPLIVAALGSWNDIVKVFDTVRCLRLACSLAGVDHHGSLALRSAARSPELHALSAANKRNLIKLRPIEDITSG